MFVILINYQAPLTDIDQHLAAHRAYLTQGYDQGILLASGPRVPRTGGVILCLLKTRDEVDAFIAKDPFYRQQLASYEVIEFTPVLHHAALKDFINPAHPQ